MPKEKELLSKPIERVMDRVWAQYENQNNVTVPEQTRLLAMAMLNIEEKND